MSPRTSILLLPELVPEQEFPTGYVSTVVGPVEFRVWKKQLERIDEMLGLSEGEKTLQRLSLKRRNEDEQCEAERENRPFRPGPQSVGDCAAAASQGQAQGVGPSELSGAARFETKQEAEKEK